MYKVITSESLNSGGIYKVIINTRGSGYNESNTLTIDGDGTGATAEIVLGPLADQVGSIIVTNPGSGYVTAPIVSTLYPPVNEMTAIAHLSTLGSVKSVTIENGGSGYTIAPTVAFIGGGGNGAIGTAILNAGVVESVNIINAGTNYSTTPTIEFTGDGIDAAGTVVIGFGIESVEVTVSGNNYNNGESVIFTGGEGTGATGIINTVDNTPLDNIGNVIITSPGSGYTYATITINGQGQDGYLIPLIDSLVNKVNDEIEDGTLYGNMEVSKIGGKTIYIQTLNYVASS